MREMNEKCESHTLYLVKSVFSTSTLSYLMFINQSAGAPFTLKMIFNQTCYIAITHSVYRRQPFTSDITDSYLCWAQ